MSLSNDVLPLKDKVVVITGGARGIGRSIAEFCAQAGARVALCARSENEVKDTLKALEKISAGPHLGEVCDVTDEKQLKTFYEKTREKLGAFYGLIAAAGVYGSIGPFLKTDFSEWKKALEINLFGTALSIHLGASFFPSSGGRIILFSGGGQGPLPNFSPYVTSKGGIWRLTETLGAELATQGLFLNAIAPGAVNTQLLDELLAAGPDKVGTEFYQKSLAQKEQGGTSPQKAAELVLYLLSEKSKGLYGKTLSAVWDPYNDFKNLEQMSRSDIYQPRRVVNFEGGTRS